MADIDSFCIKVCDSGLLSESENVPLRFPISTFFEMLCKDFLKDNNLRITSYDFVPNSSTIMYLPATSIIKRYHLIGEHHGIQDFDKIVIVKLRNQDPRYNKHGVGILHENEIMAYANILPFLNQEEFGVDPLPIPEVYFAFKNLIIMEDLNQRCFYIPDKALKGITTYQCRLILKTLARFHSHSIVAQMKEPKKFDEIKRGLKENLFYSKQSKMIKYKKQFLDLLLAVLEKHRHFSPEMESAIEALKNVRITFVEQIKKLIIYPKKHSVICHGDLRASNIFIHEDTGEIKFVDFQQIYYSSVARDLVTLLYVNLEPRDMGYLMQMLVACYLNNLHICLNKQGINLESELTTEWLHEEMMRFQIYGIVYGLWHSAEFYIESIGDWTSIDILSKEKYEKPQFTQNFIERAAAMLTFYGNQIPPAVDPPNLIEVNPPKLSKVDSPKLIKVDPPKLIEADPPKLIEVNSPKVIKVDSPKLIKVDPPKLIEVDPPKFTEV